MPYGTLFETLEEWNGCRRDRRCRWIQARASGGRKGRGARSGAGGRLRRALEINPDSGYALNDLGTLQLLEGNAAEAAATYRKIEVGSFRRTGLAMAQHALGHAKESQQSLDEVIAKNAQDAAYQIGEAYAWRVEKDKAFEWLERAYRQQDGGPPSARTFTLAISA